ncbi:hypothetical protein TPY_2943 [Sulfobacillus acidophilus TPY]|nr:hypothetical protein TPY_2943 [Sulfobacillus acidophilus TPY]
MGRQTPFFGTGGVPPGQGASEQFSTEFGKILDRLFTGSKNFAIIHNIVR